MGITLVLVSMFNLYTTSSLQKAADSAIAKAKEESRPAKIEIISLLTPSCSDCFDVAPLVKEIEATGVNVTQKKELMLSDAQELIKQYQIKKAPTVIVMGEIEKSRALKNMLSEKGEESVSGYIITKIAPPYVDTESNKIRGKVNITLIKKQDCKECFDITPYIAQLKSAGLAIDKEKNVNEQSTDGSKLIAKYNIKKLPTLVLTSEAQAYPDITAIWPQIGLIDKDGSYIMTQVSAPYYDLESARTFGLLNMTTLKDKSCTTCYDTETFHKPILARMGVKFEKELTLDSTDKEGQELIKKYNIKKIPTILLWGDVKAYPILEQAWKDVGTKEEDSTYVFRQVEVARQPYKDLTKNAVVDPAKQVSNVTSA